MTSAQVLGALLLSLPFVAVFVYLWLDGGLRVAVAFYVLVALTSAVVLGGLYLTTGSLS